MLNRLVIKLFFRILRQDKKYRSSWHDNIAMAIYSAGVTHEEANKQAGNFMQMLIGINTYLEWEKRFSGYERECCHSPE